MINFKIKESQREALKAYANKYHEGNVSAAIKAKLKRALTFKESWKVTRHKDSASHVIATGQ